jgi:hypothetical protein
MKFETVLVSAVAFLGLCCEATIEWPVFFEHLVPILPNSILAESISDKCPPKSIIT